MEGNMKGKTGSKENTDSRQREKKRKKKKRKEKKRKEKKRKREKEQDFSCSSFAHWYLVCYLLSCTIIRYLH